MVNPPLSSMIFPLKLPFGSEITRGVGFFYCSSEEDSDKVACTTIFGIGLEFWASFWGMGLISAPNRGSAHQNDPGDK